jgi:hypothetical protein
VDGQDRGVDLRTVGQRQLLGVVHSFERTRSARTRVRIVGRREHCLHHRRRNRSDRNHGCQAQKVPTLGTEMCYGSEFYSVFRNAISARLSSAESFNPNSCPFTARVVTP